MNKTVKITAAVLLVLVLGVLYLRSDDGKALLSKTEEQQGLIQEEIQLTGESVSNTVASVLENTEALTDSSIAGIASGLAVAETGFSDLQKEELKEIISEALSENLNGMLEDGRLPEALGKYTEVTSGLVNINTADEEELTKLNGIGPAKAKAIVEYRNQNGAFGSVYDLENVSGISTGTVEKLKDQATV